MLCASGYWMSRSPQVSYTGSGDYNKYVFTCICKPHRCYPGSTGLFSIDQIDKQGYISHITAVGGNLLVRLSSRDLHNADDPICSLPTIIVSINLRRFLRGGFFWPASWASDFTPRVWSQVRWLQAEPKICKLENAMNDWTGNHQKCSQITPFLK